MLLVLKSGCKYIFPLFMYDKFKKKYLNKTNLPSFHYNDRSHDWPLLFTFALFRTK